jgi:DNA adenine methylase (dam)
MTTCYNGLYRVNKKNQFNTPIGTNQKYDLERLVKCSSYLNNNNCIIESCSFSNYKTDDFCNSFFYLDPPYYSEDNSIYNNYTSNRFKESDQETLKTMCDYIDAKKGYFLLSNSNTSFIKQLYNRYDIKEVVTKRKISSKRSSRGDVVELLISNY